MSSKTRTSWIRDDKRVLVYMNDLACSNITPDRAVMEAMVELPKLSPIKRTSQQIRIKLSGLRYAIKHGKKICTPKAETEATVEILPMPIKPTITYKVAVASPRLVTPNGESIPLPGEFYLEYELKLT